jgi:hypothetical protein
MCYCDQLKDKVLKLSSWDVCNIELTGARRKKCSILPPGSDWGKKSDGSDKLCKLPLDFYIDVVYTIFGQSSPGYNQITMLIGYG